ncbi:uncharacterized protein LOC129584423 [Paramacrobiotus metropolitanus]|uniref:uncharacterized protein LOC129584423 n=1 Tax=Paramacrobiotus metropolitanus TaxID=2943436 RepID=UPI002445AA67|nr:uncharacterized protein LOC129584423 [Paramacrobiotus metropolitanus]
MLRTISMLLILSTGLKAAHHGDPCFDNIQCTDSGLTCTGARCYCYMDLGEEVARYWACNTDDDCPVLDSNQSTWTGNNDQSPDNDSNNVKKLACIPSEECPLVEGFSGYCYVGRQ